MVSVGVAGISKSWDLKERFCKTAVRSGAFIFARILFARAARRRFLDFKLMISQEEEAGARFESECRGPSRGKAKHHAIAKLWQRVC